MNVFVALRPDVVHDVVLSYPAVLDVSVSKLRISLALSESDDASRVGVPSSYGVLGVGCAGLLRGDVVPFVEDVLVGLDIHDDDKVVLELSGTLQLNS